MCSPPQECVGEEPYLQGGKTLNFLKHLGLISFSEASSLQKMKSAAPKGL